MSIRIRQKEVWEATDPHKRQYVLEKDETGRFVIGRKVIFEKASLVQTVGIARAPVWAVKPEEVVIWYQLNVESR